MNLFNQLCIKIHFLNISIRENYDIQAMHNPWKYMLCFCFNSVLIVRLTPLKLRSAAMRDSTVSLDVIFSLVTRLSHLPRRVPFKHMMRCRDNTDHCFIIQNPLNVFLSIVHFILIYICRFVGWTVIWTPLAITVIKSSKVTIFVFLWAWPCWTGKFQLII